MRIEAVPPVLGAFTWGPIPDNDGGNPTKTFTIPWDSRHIYNGGGLLLLTALDDPDNDNNYDDLSASAQLALTINNPTRNPVWMETFQSIGTLGGLSGANFDGDWYTWTFGTSAWRVVTEAGGGHNGSSKYARMGPAGVGGNYGSSEFDQLYSPVHNISGATRPYLRLYHKLDVEAGGGDWGKILFVRYDGLNDNEMTLGEFRIDSSPAGQWKELVFDLSSFKAEPFRTNFLFISDSDSNFGAGWFIDDYEVLDANPQITGIVDPSGPRGKVVTVNGQRFGSQQGSSFVTFQKEGGGTTTAAVTSWSNTAITVTVPNDAISGNVVVNVLGFASNGHYFGVSLAAPNLGGLAQL